MDSSQDYSDTCPWAYLAECVEGDMFPQELLDKLKAEKEDVKILKKYREEMAKIEEITGDEVEDIVDVKDYIKKLQEEQLTEENAIQYVYENTSEYDDWVKGSEVYKELQENLQQEKDGRCADLDELEAEIKELQEENKKLKKENKHLCAEITELKEELDNEESAEGLDLVIINKLQEKNTELREEIKKLKESAEGLDLVDLLRLTVQNEKLKKFALKVHNFAYGTEWDDEDIVSSMDFDVIMVEMNKDENLLIAEIKQLEEEVKIQRKANEAYEDLMAGEKGFIDEIKELKEELLYYRFYTYTLDRSGDCDLTKEDVDKFTDDEAQRKDLYERIGYEEDESEDDSDDPDEE